MEYAIAAIFGVSTGILITCSVFPRTRYLPYIAASIVLIVGVLVAGFSAIGNPGYGIAIAVGGLVGATLTGGVVWRDHPMLAGSGYWSRVAVAFAHSGSLRRSFAEPTEPELTIEKR